MAAGANQAETFNFKGPNLGGKDSDASQSSLFDIFNQRAENSNDSDVSSLSIEIGTPGNDSRQSAAGYARVGVKSEAPDNGKIKAFNQSEENNITFMNISKLTGDAVGMMGTEMLEKSSRQSVAGAGYERVGVKFEAPDDGNTKGYNQTMVTNAKKPPGDTMGMESFAHKSGSNKAATRATKSKDRVLQRRMALLCHASRCNAPDGTCRVSRHCAKTRAVWNHIMTGCNDPNCGVKHGVSSRYVLSHYQDSRSSLSRGAIYGNIDESSGRKGTSRRESI